jgi:hypothetical protein
MYPNFFHTPITRSLSHRLLASILVLHQFLQLQHDVAALLKVHDLERLKRDVFEFLEAGIPHSNKPRNELIKGQLEFYIAFYNDDLDDELLEGDVLLMFEMRADYFIKETSQILLNVINKTKRGWLSVSMSDAIEHVCIKSCGGDRKHADGAGGDWEVEYVCVVVE